jgi:DNA-binding MarR family transcriptional regulator
VPTKRDAAAGARAVAAAAVAGDATAGDAVAGDASAANGAAAASPAPPPGLDALDALLQHRSRLGAMVLLSTAEAMTFTQLRDLLGETDGNLGAQLRKLEEAAYVRVDKAFVGRKPVSRYAIVPAGRAALGKHLAALEAVIRSAKV